MGAADYGQLALFLGLLIAATPFIGAFLHKTFTAPVGQVPARLYGWMGIDPAREQGWAAYALSVLAFNLTGLFFTYAVLRLQHLLPLNPQGFGAVPADLAFNTAISFVTNTNWQAYGGEATMSHFSQMVVLTVQNFVSAATGLAVAVAVIRGFARKNARQIGNFWVDLTRSSFAVLLPVCLVATLFFVAQGVPQTLLASVETVTGQKIALGPVASQLSIKMFGTNGGGFFNANSAHPFENPTALSNLVQMLLIFGLGFGITNLFGRMVGNQRQGWAILSAMVILFVGGVLVTGYSEGAGNPLLAGLDPMLGNMEGKEVRFGGFTSALFAVVTTAASCGAVIAMHSSLTPLGGGVALLNILLGEVIIGGVGAGFYGIIVFIVVTLFVAGLMVGRSPDYVGKKLEARETKMAAIALLASPLLILIGAAIALSVEPGRAGMFSQGPHGLSEVLYAFASAAGNNGSAFAGLSANSWFYNLMLGAAMFFGRFVPIIAVLALAGSLAAKTSAPPSAGTFPTDGPMFVALLAGTILLVGGLTFLPVLALGPIAEHLAMLTGLTF
ncbi:potassium-transporting ATPase subunit KdpA [Lacibacterium aquatile]|uniref:Potassium-transporting ATPase potassium-binding subunit n=1 Tax=Lacibacterium aquatile TaxID=1168082 RepID=A0ABW5DP15_9PROT